MTTAQWFLSLDTYCPKCESAFDLLDDSEFWHNSGVQACENQTDKSRDVEAVCPRCNHKFTVDLEY